MVDTTVTSSEVAAVIAHSWDLLLLGYFDDSLAALDGLVQQEDISTTERVETYRAAARVFLRRGYPKLAKEWLDKASELPLQDLSITGRLYLDIHREFVSIVGCGQEGQDESRLLEARHYLDSVGRREDIDSSLVELHTFLDRIALVRQVLQDRKGNSTRGQVSSRMHELAEIAKRNGRYNDIYMLSSTLLVSSGPTQAIEWLAGILQATDVPAAIRGCLCLELAKQLASAALMERCADWLDEAENSFRACEHAWGPSEVRLVRLQHGLTGSSNILSDLINLANQHLQAGFLFGFLQASMTALSLAFGNNNSRTYFHLQEVLHHVCDLAGLYHEGLLREVELLAALNAGGSDAGKVLELGSRLYQDCLDRKWWTPAYLVGRVISLSHSQLANFDESVVFAQEIYDLCSRESLRLESQAAYHLAFVQSSRARKNADVTASEFRKIVEWLLNSIDADIITEDVEDKETACDKLCLIAGLQFELLRTVRQDAVGLREMTIQTIARARRLADELPEDTRTRIHANCDDVLITQLLREGRHLPHDEREIEAISVCDRLIAAYQARGPKFMEAIKYMVRASCHQQRFQKESDLNARVSYMVSAESDLCKSTEIFESIRSRQQVLVSRHHLTRLHVTARDFFRTPLSTELVFNSLKSLETTAEMLRRELSALDSLRALLQKQKFIAGVEISDLYRWAIGVSLSEQNLPEMWLWSQKRKARSLSDLLGIGVLVPASARKAIAADRSANELFAKFNCLLTAIERSNEAEKTYLRQQLEEVEEEIRTKEAFTELVALRDGKISGIADLKKISEHTVSASKPRNIIFADWIAYNDLILVLTASTTNPEETCQLAYLPIGVSTVQQWIRENFTTVETRKTCLKRDNLRDPSKPMRKLDCLIHPVLRASKPGDLLILSVTGCLAALPLHTLKTTSDEREMALIERNPVVYAPSFPVLDVCLSRSRKPVIHGDNQSVFVGIYDIDKEASRIYSQMNKLATSMDGKDICGPQATKSNFTAAAQGVRHLHYHGHCRFTVDNPLKQSLVLATKPEDNDRDVQSGLRETDELLAPKIRLGDILIEEATAEPVPDPSVQSENIQSVWMPDESALSRENNELALLLSLGGEDLDTCLAVPEIFQLQLVAALVVLIGCESASQTIAEGDEPLGLISALLCAGAASVVGASWPIPSSAGRQFSDNFYAQMKAGRGVDGEQLVDLATALQESVLLMMDDPEMSAPYYWGAFCLYGSWEFCRSGIGPELKTEVVN